MIAQSVGWKPVDVPVQTDFHIAGFHTDNYRTRISSYEKKYLVCFQYAFLLWKRCSVGAFFPVGYCEATFCVC